MDTRFDAVTKTVHDGPASPVCSTMPPKSKFTSTWKSLFPERCCFKSPSLSLTSSVPHWMVTNSCRWPTFRMFRSNYLTYTTHFKLWCPVSPGYPAWHELGSLSDWSTAFVSSLPSKPSRWKKKNTLLSILYKYNTHGGDFNYYPKERPTSLLYSEKETARCNSCWKQMHLFP